MISFARLSHLFTSILLSLTLVISSCVPSTNGRSRSLSSTSNKISNGGQTPPNSNSAVGSDSNTSSGALFSQKIELSHLVDPFDGTYKKKLTLPKNFKGNLYIAGLNISALINKIIYVRFNFGVEKQSIVLNTTIARAPGIVPKTDIQVLVIDMNKAPFSKMRLGYDLYDYNDYDTDTTKEVVSDPKDGNLYCRGLRLEDDPTYIPTSQVSVCKEATDKCLYSYAKVLDATLYSKQTIDSVVYDITSNPTRPNVWSEANSVRSPTTTSMAETGCLPDTSDPTAMYELFDVNAMLFTIGFDAPLLGFYYRGPYRTINDADWQIVPGSAATFNSKFGLFSETGNSLTSTYTGFHSYLFPRAGKLSLSQGTAYLGSTDKFGVNTTRSRNYVNSAGATTYVDGCNLRALNYDPSTNEGIGSCNVNASIEIYYVQDGKEVSITTDKAIKLQLIRPSLTNYLGKEVLTSAFKRCDTSTQCGADECCFNSRCWSKDLVTQCVDQTPIVGNQEIGANCTSDYECASLCCNQTTGACSPHNPNGSNQIFCSKSAGQQCVTKEFCKQEPVVTCKIVKTGFKLDGTVACALRCPAVMTFGDCKSGICVPPAQPTVPTFDPNDCSKAVDP